MFRFLFFHALPFRACSDGEHFLFEGVGGNNKTGQKDRGKAGGNVGGRPGTRGHDGICFFRDIEVLRGEKKGGPDEAPH